MLANVLLALLSSFILTLLVGPIAIRWLKSKQHAGQPIRDCGPQSHQKKAGTPTMGGAFILPVITIVTLYFTQDPQALIVLAMMWVFGILGYWDDYRKVIQKNPKGLPGRFRFLLECVFAGVFLYSWQAMPGYEAMLWIPVMNTGLPLSDFWYGALVLGVIVGTSNAVNLTDGLDGLAITPVALVAAALGWLAFIFGAGPLTLLCAAVTGAGLGFLWFNTQPARVFMGDVGSLGLGAMLGTLAVLLHMELVLFIMGFLFVMETLSVILQVGSYKLRKKRIFKMAPLHHHFELGGWTESQVIVRAWISTVLFVIVGLSTLWV